MEAITLETGRPMQYHVADQCGPDQVAEFMIDYLTNVVGLDNCTEFQRDLATVLEATLAKYCGARV